MKKKKKKKKKKKRNKQTKHMHCNVSVGDIQSVKKGLRDSLTCKEERQDISVNKRLSVVLDHECALLVRNQCDQVYPQV